MSLVRITSNLSLNTDDVSACVVDQRHYVNGPGPAWLIIRMRDRSEHRVEHTPHLLGGVDIFAIKRQLEGEA